VRRGGGWLAAGLAVATLAAAPVQAPPPGPAPVIDPAGLRAHMRFLSDDLLQGRATGSDGYLIAARYVAAQFEALGLKPAGTEGFMQPVPLRSAQVDGDKSWLRLSVPGLATSELKHTDQVLIAPSFTRAQDEVQGPVVFVGYGIVAPDLQHDDYAGVDVRGKVVAMFSGAPRPFPSMLRAHYSSQRLKSENAATRGAVAILILGTPHEAHIPWTSYVRYASAPAMRWMHGDVVEGALPQLHGGALVGVNVSDRILTGAGRTPASVYEKAAAGKRDSFATGARIVLRTVTRHRALRSPNVAAVLPGSDPQLRAETVVYSAHLDHLGTGDPVDGDGIFNGAVDNASGVAALIEIARAFASRPQAPRRTVLFLAVTGEEVGLLGSDYFAHHPTVPAGSIVANINMDGLGLLLGSADVVGIGAESSTLQDALQQAAAQLGMPVSPDPVADQALFIRSDQYSFVRQGVPAVFVNFGFKPPQPGQDMAEAFNRWLGTVYHTPKDDMAQPGLDLAAGARLTRVNLLLGIIVADQPERPRWKPGDFFGKTYGKP
jgi:Zn-dependent M28 family amino/carboxypeptidase